MAQVVTKPKPVAKSSTHHEPILFVDRFPVPSMDRFETFVHRSSELSDTVLGSLEKGERATIEALGEFVITLEETLPTQVATTSEVMKKITESGLHTTDRVVRAEYDFLRNVIKGVAESLSIHDGTQRRAAH